MRDLVTFLSETLGHADPLTAHADAQLLRSEHRLRNAGVSSQGLPRTISYEQRRRLVFHELGHAFAVLEYGGVIDAVRIHAFAGTGEVRYSAISDPLHSIVIALAGPIAELFAFPTARAKYSQSDCDLLEARQRIDALNATPQWPPLTYRAAVAKAVNPVERNWQKIRAVSLALNDCGELNHEAVVIFANCGFFQ